mgnify:CR=1 FL=1
MLELWKRGHIEPAIAPRKPFHILAQQIMALVLERPGIPLSELKRRISPFMSAAEISGTEGEALLLHLYIKRGATATSSQKEEALLSPHYKKKRCYCYHLTNRSGTTVISSQKEEALLSLHYKKEETLLLLPHK